MYKVFVNEKKLTLSNYPVDVEKTLHFEGTPTLEIALDLLENTSCPEINVYSDDAGSMWEDFTRMFKIIDAAGGIVKNNEGKILFIHRLGKWDMPKGKIEPGESLEQAAIREVEEETSLRNLELGEFINSTLHIYRERSGQRVLKTTYWYQMFYKGEEQPVPQIEEGITQVDWKNVGQIRDEVLPNTFKNIQLILSETGFSPATELP